MFLEARLRDSSDKVGIALLTVVAFGAGVLASQLIAPSSVTPRVEPEVVPIISRTAYPAQVVRVVDGDTFEARVQVWPGMEAITKIRLRGIDAPEMSGRCAEEIQQAQAARDRLAAILAQGDIGIAQVGQDKYGGRVLANASTPRTPDVSAAMLEARVVRSYNGGKREGWCR